MILPDSETDIRTARNADVPVVAVTFGYTETPGIAPLRRAIARHYQHRSAPEGDPDVVGATPGSPGGVPLAVLAPPVARRPAGAAHPGLPPGRGTSPPRPASPHKVRTRSCSPAPRSAS